MTRVPVTVEEIDIEGDYGFVRGVEVACDECGQSVKVFGTSVASIKRGCVMLREQCDRQNFYFYDDDDGD